MLNLLTDYELQALILSLKISSVAVFLSLPFAIILSWVLARKRFFGKNILDGLIHLPLVLPPVVIGYLLLISMGRQGFIGHFLYKYLNISLSFSWQGAVLAVSIVSFPLMVRSIRLSIENIDQKLEEAAKTLGANNFRIFFTITLPLMLPGVITGAILAFSRSLGEFGATITFVSNIAGETQTIPLAMYSFIETPGSESNAWRLCVISIVIALFSIFISEWLSGKAQIKLIGKNKC